MTLWHYFWTWYHTRKMSACKWSYLYHAQTENPWMYYYESKMYYHRDRAEHHYAARKTECPWRS